MEDEAVLAVLSAQEDAGVDLVTDGEQRRDNFYSFVAEKLEGVRLMTLAEMLDLVEDKAGFEEILRTLDVPAYSISNPTCVGRIARREPLALGELEFLRRHTARPIKIPLPGPYLLTRSMFVQEVTRSV
jgi:5-methyltetrahydropteroyltriglutamate--homocysteine methyltransferase